MTNSFCTLVAYLMLLVVNTSTVSHRWKPFQTSVYRKALSKILTHECNANRCLMCQIKDDAHPFMMFEDTFSCLDNPPVVTIQEYLREIYYNLHFDGIDLINDEIFVVVILYMGRLMERTRIKVTYWNVHRILCMSIWMACKMHYDVPFWNNISAPAFGLDIEGMNSIPFLIG